jgi:hypothetical protein
MKMWGVPCTDNRFLEEYQGFEFDVSYFRSGSFVFAPAEIRDIMTHVMTATAIAGRPFQSDNCFTRIAYMIHNAFRYDMTCKGVDCTGDIRHLWKLGVTYPNPWSAELIRALSEADVDCFPVIVYLYLHESRPIPPAITDAVVAWFLRDRISKRLSFKMWIVAKYWNTELHRLHAATAAVARLDRCIWHDFHKFVKKAKSLKNGPHLRGSAELFSDVAMYVHECGWRSTWSDFERLHREFQGSMPVVKEEEDADQDEGGGDRGTPESGPGPCSSNVWEDLTRFQAKFQGEQRKQQANTGPCSSAESVERPPFFALQREPSLEGGARRIISCLALVSARA